MKKFLLTLLFSSAVLHARAQLFSPEAFTGAAFGAWIGGIAGNNGNNGCCYNNGFSGQGAAIGAGIGLLVGAIAGEANRRAAYEAETVAYIPAPAVSVGYGYVDGGSAAYVYYSPNRYTAPGYYYQPTPRPNYAVGGTLLGAASGALIGAGNEQAGEGAAIGAAAGLVLGGIAESAARKQEQRTATTQTTTQVQQPTDLTMAQPAVAEQPVSRNEITSRPCATSTYYWTPRPQIADAPRVPDAPTF